MMTGKREWRSKLKVVFLTKLHFTRRSYLLSLPRHLKPMRKSVFLLAIAGMACVLFTGCTSGTSGITGPQRKLGRGINNLTEIPRGGEMRRSIEQTGIFHGPEVAYTSGVIHGFNRSISRTLVGAYEIVTFPFPNGPGKDFSPIMLPERTVYPDAYRPGLLGDSLFSTDTNLGFSGGDVMPFVPGSRFKIFDN